MRSNWYLRPDYFSLLYFFVVAVCVCVLYYMSVQVYGSVNLHVP